MSNEFQPEFEIIKHKVELALHHLYRNDHFLITNSTNERSITHKFSEYLQQLFSEWHVDCEYNRRGENHPKDLPDQETSYPDIIIHKRNTIDNLLIIEAKSIHSQNHSDEADKRKIFSFIQDERYAYCYGLWICFFDEISESQLDWFQNIEGSCCEVIADE